MIVQKGNGRENVIRCTFRKRGILLDAQKLENPTENPAQKSF